MNEVAASNTAGLSLASISQPTREVSTTIHKLANGYSVNCGYGTNNTYCYRELSEALDKVREYITN